MTKLLSAWMAMESRYSYKVRRRKTSIRMVTTMQTKCSCRNKCVLFAVHISCDKVKEVEDAYILGMLRM